MREYAFELVLAAALVGIFVLLGVSSHREGAKFEKACTAAHGTTVFDGRQHQCLKAKE
jgi:hypothetical protein